MPTRVDPPSESVSSWVGGGSSGQGVVLALFLPWHRQGGSVPDVCCSSVRTPCRVLEGGV